MKKLFLSLSIFLLIGSVITSCTSDDIISDEYSAPTDISVNKQAGAREIGEKLLDSFGISATRSSNDNEYPLIIMEVGISTKRVNLLYL